MMLKMTMILSMVGAASGKNIQLLHGCNTAVSKFGPFCISFFHATLSTAKSRNREFSSWARCKEAGQRQQQRLGRKQGQVRAPIIGIYGKQYGSLFTVT